MKAVVLLLVCVVGLYQACTSVQVKYGESSYAIGRSMELPVPMKLATDWRAVTHPAHTYVPRPMKKGEIVNKEESNPIGFISIDAIFLSEETKDDDVLHILSGEGMNEYGLSVSAQTFVSSEYERVHVRDRDVVYFYFIGYALGNYKTADDLIYALRNNVSVIDPIPIPLSSAKFHWGVTDAAGSSYVIEYLQGELHVWDNSDVGVMTNDPTWGWHVENLNTYATVSPLWSNGGTNLQMKTPVGTVPKIMSNGYNTFGLPGDFTPISRFVRMWYLRETLLFNDKKAPQTIDDVTVIITALLNSVFIPKGSSASELENDGETKVDDFDFTQYDVIKFPDQKMFYFRSYENMIWKKVDLSQFNFTVGAPSVSIGIYDGEYGVQDVSNDFS
eukprot:CAMPEP_0201522702 /NCGR_PEP_ID=MMETSP0161_2-20130828/18492_1 /ASSEMBLY_ACC=CAM_ASM_000251 /TAXON_ID=180227 /ORGANISM="Neoparamoeba aestuarina, Strain SoJaBio B1-5/56/2" /LENGTH=387 /DNA_ID=CAMNT_0047921621 /DNA_START=46 /DNA_END=1209 /DNA_ORIENTATION=+